MIKAKFTTKEGIIEGEYANEAVALANAYYYVLKEKRNIAVVFEDGTVKISEVINRNQLDYKYGQCKTCRAPINATLHVYCFACSKHNLSKYN